MSKLLLALSIMLALVLSGCKTLQQQVVQSQSRAAVDEMEASFAGSQSNRGGNQSVEERPDTARYFYATGQGDTVDEAKNHALSRIASRISVSVSSSTKNTVNLQSVDSDYTTTESFERSVDAKSKSIEFTGVKILARGELEDDISVLVRVDRNVLFQSYLDKLDAIDSKISEERKIFSSADIFTQLKLSESTRGLIEEGQVLLPILKAMLASFDAAEYRNRYQAFERELRNVTNNAVFTISADNNSKALATLVKNYLSDANIKMSNSNGNVRLHLKTDFKEKQVKSSNPKFANMKMVNRTTTFNVKNNAGVTISNNVVKTKGSSTSSVEDAIQNTKPYERLIQRKGILGFLSGK